MTDVVSIFEAYATTQNWSFAYGSREILDYETNQKNLTSGKYILWLFPFDEKAIINTNVGVVTDWDLSTMIWLGRKFDNTAASGTRSSLDETQKQKYDRRLLAIREELATLIKTIFCSGNYELKSARIRREINVSSTNIDFVVCEVTFQEL